MADFFSESVKQRILKRAGALRQDFGTHEPRLRELADNFCPRRVRWNKGDFNRGEKLASNIINNTPLIAGRVVASGLMAAVTNPLGEWFRLTTPDPELAEFGPVRMHLHLRASRIRTAFALGTFYKGLADGIYPDVSVFGFACGLLEEHATRFVLLQPQMIGEYYLAANENDEINSLYREIPMTVRQCIRQFGLRADKSIDWTRFSSTVKNLWQQGKQDAVLEVINVIEPNEEMEPGQLGARGMPYASRWLEKASDREDKWLRIAGYHDFPAVCPRWTARPGEAYGRGLGDDALGDAKELQHEERRTAGMLDKSVNPPMVADEATRGQRKSLVAGDVTYAPRGQGEGFKPAMEVRDGAIRHAQDHILRTEDRVDRAMMVDLFLKLLRDNRAQPKTAREIDALVEQTALQIGPALQNLNPELLKRSVDRVDGMLERRGWMPPAPPELEGVELKVEFISIMHQAQRGVGLGPIRVFLGEMAVLANMKPSALDKLDEDEIADAIADATGIAPGCLLSDEEVDKVRQARAEREAAAAQGEAMERAAKAGAAVTAAPAPAADNLGGTVLQTLSPAAATGAALRPFGPLAGSGFPQ